MEPTELAGKRTERRRRLREQSPDVLVALPDTDGDLGRALSDLEEVLLKVVDGDDDHEQALPAPLADPQSVEAVGKLASYVGRVERAVESERPLVQPLAPDGRYELVPLHFVRLNRDEHARILAAVGQLAAAGTPDSHPAVGEALSDYAWGRGDAVKHLVASAERVAALLGLEWDDDVDVLGARLGRDVDQDPERVVLTTEEYETYLRVTERILATWHAGSSLDRFVYRGSI